VGQEHDAPSEHMLTTYDLAFLSQEQHPQRRRSDFLTGSALSRVHAPPDWLLNKVSEMKLANFAAWTISTAPFLKKTDFQTSAATLEDAHQAYLMKDPVTRKTPSAASSREIKAANTLALDLGLSESVYSQEVPSSPSTQSRTTYDDLESATGALSLKDPEPPALSFGYLHPRPRHAFETAGSGSQATADKPATDGEMDASLGARLLLSEWIHGSNPDEYHYVDPYGVTEPGEQIARTPRQKTTFDPTSVVPALSQQGPGRVPDVTSAPGFQPPTILSTHPPPVLSNQPAPARRPFPSSATMPFASQLPRQLSHGAATLPVSSQEMWPSTQQVRGPFGERPEARAAKKKAAKKRMAGF